MICRNYKSFFLPLKGLFYSFTNLSTIIAAEISVVVFIAVAIESTTVEISIIIGIVDSGKPKEDIRRISAVYPPPGTAPQTEAAITDTTIAIIILLKSRSIFKIPVRRAIFIIWIITVPSLWRFAPSGRTILLISSLIPILSPASKFAGSAAAEELVPKAVKNGGQIFFQNLLIPLLPPPMKAIIVFTRKWYKKPAAKNITMVLPKGPTIFDPCSPVRVAK